jgi:hypothetical protein
MRAVALLNISFYAYYSAVPFNKQWLEAVPYVSGILTEPVIRDVLTALIFPTRYTIRAKLLLCGIFSY